MHEKIKRPICLVPKRYMVALEFESKLGWLALPRLAIKETETVYV